MGNNINKYLFFYKINYNIIFWYIDITKINLKDDEVKKK